LWIFIEMQKKDSFVSNSKFYSDKHFPHGFARCGEFSREQADLLERHGRAYEALDSGKREPITAEETRFIAVCRGEAEPVSAHEDVWMRYRRKIEKRPTVSPFGTIIKAVRR
jgi:hypothetical protein